MKLSAIVAASRNNAIGLRGNLLWSLPRDMQYFKKVTYGHHVLMGRKSYESLPDAFRPLPGRINIVVTRQKDFKADGCKVVSTFEEGIQFAKESGESELMILGGGEVYAQLLSVTDRVYLTKVDYEFEEADAYFPELDMKDWKVISREKHLADSKHQYNFEFIVLDKVQNK